MAIMTVNYGTFDGWAQQISGDNDNLKATLEEICATINALEVTYQSNASTAIREKITNMKPRFDQYYQVVDNYVRFIRTTGQAYKAIENVNTNEANQFI